MVIHAQEHGHDSGTLHGMGSHDWLLNMATKRWHQCLRVVQPRNAAPANYQVAPALPGGWVRGCSCGSAPVPSVLGVGGSNPPQVCDPSMSVACRHTTGERVQKWHANETFCMCHGTCRRLVAAGVTKRCSALEHIADFLSNALQSGGLFIGGVVVGNTMLGAYLRASPQSLPRRIWPGGLYTAHTGVRVLCANSHFIVWK